MHIIIDIYSPKKSWHMNFQCLSSFLVIFPETCYIKYWIYNLICVVFFSKFELLFKKNMYNSIIQSIAHLKL